MESLHDDDGTIEFRCDELDERRATTPRQSFDEKCHRWNKIQILALEIGNTTEIWTIDEILYNVEGLEVNLRHKRIVAKVRCEQFGKERRKNRQRTNPVKCVFDLFGDDELEEQPHNGRCIGRNSDKSERHEMTRRRNRLSEM